MVARTEKKRERRKGKKSSNNFRPAGKKREGGEKGRRVPNDRGVRTCKKEKEGGGGA